MTKLAILAFLSQALTAFGSFCTLKIKILPDSLRKFIYATATLIIAYNLSKTTKCKEYTGICCVSMCAPLLEGLPFAVALDVDVLYISLHKLSSFITNKYLFLKRVLYFGKYLLQRGFSPVKMGYFIYGDATNHMKTYSDRLH